MKLITLFLFLSFSLLKLSICLVHNEERLQNYEDNTLTDYTLKQLLEKFRQLVGNYQAIPDQQILINETKIFLNASLSKGSVTDPSSFNIDLAHVNMSALEFFVDLSYAAMSIKGAYSLYLDNEYVHMESSDSFCVDVSNMSVSLYIKLNLTKDQTLQMENFTLNYNISVKVDIKYLGGSAKVSDTLNKLMNDMMPSLIQSTKPDVQRIASGIAFKKSQFIIGGMTLQQFIDLINSIIN